MAKRSFFGVILEVIILLIFIIPMFNLNFITGFFYIIAIFYAFSSGLITQRRNISWMIIFGTLLSYLAGRLIPYALGSYLAGDITSAVIIGILILYIWTKARKMKKGKK